MGIPQDVAEQVLVNCGRRCCLCRRFLPIRLQVHHIDEKAKGGSDEPDNLIALCLTCHTDVHTKAPFTRRFSHDELKQHRNSVYRLVDEGKLIAGDVAPDTMAKLFHAVLAALAGQRSFDLPTSPPLGLAAVRIRIDGRRRPNMSGMEGMIQIVAWSGGATLLAAGKQMSEGNDARETAELRHGLQQLEGFRLVERDSSEGCFLVTYEGFLLSDQILAAGGEVL